MAPSCAPITMVPLPSFSSLHRMHACCYRIYLFIACLLFWKRHSMKSETLSCLSLYPLYLEQCPAPIRPSINLLSKLDIPGTSELSFPQGAAACFVCTHLAGSASVDDCMPCVCFRLPVNGRCLKNRACALCSSEAHSSLPSEESNVCLLLCSDFGFLLLSMKAFLKEVLLTSNQILVSRLVRWRLLAYNSHVRGLSREKREGTVESNSSVLDLCSIRGVARQLFSTVCDPRPLSAGLRVLFS